MNYVYRPVLEDAFNWYGLNVTISGNIFHVSQGRIGRFENPLCKRDGKIVGGWYVKETTYTMPPEIRQVDIMLKDDNTYVLFRSSDPSEVCPAEYELLLSLAWKEGGQWYSVKPRREASHEATTYRR